MTPTTRRSKPVKPCLEGETPACSTGPQVQSLGAALLCAFGFIVVCGAGILALVALWGQSLF